MSCQRVINEIHKHSVILLQITKLMENYALQHWQPFEILIKSKKSLFSLFFPFALWLLNSQTWNNLKCCFRAAGQLEHSEWPLKTGASEHMHPTCTQHLKSVSGRWGEQVVFFQIFFFSWFATVFWNSVLSLSFFQAHSRSWLICLQQDEAVDYAIGHFRMPRDTKTVSQKQTMHSF